MNNYFDLVEIIENVAQEDPERVAIKSGTIRNGITYRELDEYSASVYACLKEMGIGREDVVAVVLPRDWHAIVAQFGVWKAGACIILMEDTYAKERIDFIINDSKAKLVIDYEMFMKMLEHKPLYGHEIFDEHDACFIVYTSGSTGNPKGVLHEYGIIGMDVKALEANAKPVPEGCVGAISTPMNFLVTYHSIFMAYKRGMCIYIIPYDIIKNPFALAEFLLQEKIADIFMTPSFLKVYKKASPYLINLYVGGESCDNTFIEGPNIINGYASSESGMTVATYVVSKLEEKVPAGKSIPEDLLIILDENGTPVANGEIGEICIRNYFTRGYLNLPDKNAETFHDGICHMGDLGCIREDGNLMVYGRKDDMVKINGNRIALGEIENVLKRVLHLENTVVKSFKNGNRTYLCAYFLRDEMNNSSVLDENENVNSAKINTLIQNYLPDYMVPSYYVLLEKYPVNANGKLSRKDLVAPNLLDYRSNYIAPENEVEKKICTCFATVLELDRVGINDDFFLIGGDSLAAAEFMLQCELRGLSVRDLYQYRTPRKLATYCMKNYSGSSISYESNLSALKHSQVLTPEMLDMFDKKDSSPSSVWYLPLMMKCTAEVDPERLKNAVNKVFRHHSSLNSIIDYSDDGSLRISYSPEKYSEIEIEYMTEDAFISLLNTSVRPFNVINAPLYNAVICKTPEDTYLFLNFFHAIIDGTSIGILMDEIKRCYDDENFAIEKDCFYSYLSDREIKRASDKNREVKDYYSKLLQENIIKQGIPFTVREDNAINSGILGVFQGVLSKNKTELAQSNLSKHNRNGLFMMAYLLAIASLNGKNGAYLEWVYNGRDNLDVINQVGLLYRTFALAISFEDDESIGALAEDVKAQMNYAIEHPDARMSDAVPGDQSRTCTFLYQKDIYSNTKAGLIEEVVDFINEPGDFYENIECEFIDSYECDEYRCVINYRREVYDEETIQELFRRFDCTVGLLIDSEHPEKLLIKDIIRIVAG